MNNFSFNVAYTVTRCCECPSFRESEYGNYCCHISAPRCIEDRLDCDYTETISNNCPERPSPDDSED